MAIDPKLVSIKTAGELPVSDPTDNANFLFYEGEALKRSPMANIYDKVSSGLLPATTSTVPATTGFERYIVHEAGTYTNFGGIVVTAADLDVVSGVANNRVILEVNEGVATKRVERLKGDEGISPYDVALDNGFVGTEPEWLASLKVGEEDIKDAIEAKISTANVENAAYVFEDESGRIIMWIDASGQIYALNDGESINVKIQKLENAIVTNGGTDIISGFSDASGKLLFYIDKNGGVYLGNEKSIQENSVSPVMLKARRYEQSGDMIKANYFYDIAENINKNSISIEKLIADDGDDNSIQRMPAIEVLSENKILMIWQQIRRPNTGDGAGVRLMQCFINYDEQSNALTVYDKRVFDQPSGWENSLYAATAPNILKTISGKLLVIYNYNNNPDSGLVEHRILDTVMRYSDDDGETWSDREIIMPAEGSAIPRILSTGSTSTIIQKKHGTHLNRIICPVWGSALGRIGVIYSDDDGETWSKSMFNAPFSANESSIIEQLDGTLLLHVRTEAPNIGLVYCTSTDGGETWISNGMKPNWRSSNCSSPFIQSTETLESQRKVIWSGLDNSINYSRYDMVIRLSYDEGVTYQHEFVPWDRRRMAGYSSIRKLSEDKLLLAWENGFNSTNRIYLNLYNMSEILKKGNEKI